MQATHAGAAVVFAATMLLLALGRIGRIPVRRGTASLLGGLLTAFLLELDASVVDVQVLLLLAGLMALAGLAEQAGLFAGVRRRLAHQPPWRALWLSCLLVAGASAVLLNDAAIVVLVPFLVPTLLAAGLGAIPVVTLLAVAANVGSLLTPFGNPQNAVLARHAGLDLPSFLVQQGWIVLAGLGLLAAASWWAGRHLPPTPREPPAHASATGRPWLVLCILGFVVGAAVLPLGLGTLAVTAAFLAFVGLRPLLGDSADRATFRAIDRNVLALFVGLYLLTGGLSHWVPEGSVPIESLDDPLRAGAVVTVLSNAVGNVPAILMLQRLDPAWTAAHGHFLVTASTLGGALLLTGSAASLIAADQARRLGVEVRFLSFLAWATPWVLPLLLVGAWANW